MWLESLQSSSNFQVIVAVIIIVGIRIAQVGVENLGVDPVLKQHGEHLAEHFFAFFTSLQHS